MFTFDDLRDYVVNLRHANSQQSVPQGPVSATPGPIWDPRRALADRHRKQYTNFNDKNWLEFQQKYQLSPQDLSSAQGWAKQDPEGMYGHINMYDYMNSIRDHHLPQGRP